MITFFDEDDLIDRLVHANQQKSKPVVFIVGSPLTASNSGKQGVLNVDQIVDLIRSQFENDRKSLSKLDDAISVAKQPYQSAFEFLIGRRGPSYANQIIRKAVLNARKAGKNHGVEELCDEHVLMSMEQELGAWEISKATSSLSAICLDCKDVFGKIILTTNFDPLIEIAIKNKGGEVFSSMTHGDGDIGQSTGAGVQIVHLHGFWRGSDTLHTPTQLTQPRQNLKNSLAALIKDSIVVIVGYGGWDDVITDVLSTAVNDGSSFPEIIWTFFSSSDQDIKAKNDVLISKLKPGIVRGRVAFYKGIDCHSFFPLLHNTLTQNSVQTFESDDLESINILIESDEVSQKLNFRSGSTIDAFPKNEFWFGRENEIQTLINTRAKVISISGMGGQGKSALASVFMKKARESTLDQIVVDWRDCREQSSTIHLALSGAAGRILDGSINAEELAKLSIQEVIRLFAAQLSKTKCVLVFDNIDNYVDLETSQPLDQVKELIEAVLATDTNSKIIFTSRPRITIENTFFQEIQLVGISKEASKGLFEGKSLKKIDSGELEELYDLTQGHPLWVGIIGAQCAATGKSPLIQFAEIRAGKGDLPERTMRATWLALNSKAQHLLRVLSELERPEDPRNLEDLVNIRWNQLTKSLSTLKKMSLIVVKEQDDGKELIDLHPLIRQFVRKEFPRKDRDSFINQVITFVERRLTRFGTLTDVIIPFEVLDIWLHKIELLINRQNYELAVENIITIESKLQAKGLHEEIVRLGKKIFHEIDWALSMQTVKKFDEFISETIHVIVALDGAIEAEKWIAKYESVISGKGSHYINICEIRAYVNWFENKYPDAIHWAKLGVTLMKDYDVTTRYNCAHALALAQRDSGNAADALEYFLEGVCLDNCLSGDGVSQKNAAYYGNIGRCLQFMGEPEKALKAYKVAASCFDRDGGDAMNQGYLRFWVGEVLESLGRVEDALSFYITAMNKWRGISPLRIGEAQARIDDLFSSNDELSGMIETPIWRAENRFVEWSNASHSSE